MGFGTHRAARLAAIALMLSAAGALSLGGPRPASALLSTCRSDPVVTLSNGAQIDLQAGIQDSTSDVKGVLYTVHVPAGTWVVAVVNTDGLLGLVENVRVYADNPPATYSSTTLVSTSATHVGVTATTSVVSVLGLALGIRSATGTSGQPLSVQIRSLL